MKATLQTAHASSNGHKQAMARSLNALKVHDLSASMCIHRDSWGSWEGSQESRPWDCRPCLLPAGPPSQLWQPATDTLS